jgi:amino acid transporter
VVFVAAATLLAIAIQSLGRLHEITTFSSFVFLLVFATVNGAALVHREFRGWGFALPVVGGLGCAAAAVVLAVDQYRESPALTWALVGTAAALLALRGVDLALRSR